MVVSNTSVLLNKGKEMLLNRTYLSSPTIGYPVKFQIGTSQTVPLVSATNLTNAIEFSTGVTVQSFVSGYPSIDATNKEVTIRGYLSSTQANGQLINGTGIRTSTNELISLDKFNGESKSSTDEIAFIWVHRLI